MLDFQQIKDQYPNHLQVYERALLREYLQCKVLQAIFESKEASKLAFLGGTALRIFYGNNRFSEDIDLDNFNLGREEFEAIILQVKRFFMLEGFEVEVRNVAKGAYRCYLRFPDVLYQQGISPYQDEKILIQVDSVPRGYAYQPEIKILNKFDVFTEVRLTPLNILLSQKIFTAVNRKRPKGRDFYDITFLFGWTKPDLDFLKQAMGIDSADLLKKEILERIQGYDFQALAHDVEPFLLNKAEIKRVEKYKAYWEQVVLV